MLVLNTDNINKKKLYPCYSSNLYKFLLYIKQIHPISIKVHYKTNKKFSLFVKTEELQNALTEWSNNKETNTLVFPKVGDDNETKTE